MNLNKIYKAFIFIVLLLSSNAVFAQRFVNITMNGAQTVSGIAQDEHGVMWLGTENGLYSYDGYHCFRHYDDHAFSNTRINALAFDRQMLYLATGNGLLKYNVKCGKYEIAPSMQAFNNDEKRKGIKELRAISLKNLHLGYGAEVYALLETPKGLLKGTLDGLFLVGNGKRNSRNAKGTMIRLCDGVQPLVNALALDVKRRCYWIGTEGALYRADMQLRTFTKIPELNGNSIKCLTVDNNGTLYAGTDNGLYKLTVDNVIGHFTHDSTNPASIPNNIVWACFIDKWQNLWIGTDNGLSRLATYSYYDYLPLYQVTLSKEGNCLHDVYQTHDGEWWLGGTNGLIRLGKSWYTQSNKQYPLAHNRVRKIYQDRDGDVWVCTDHGINLFNRQSQQLMNCIVYDKSARFSTAWAYDIVQDRMGRMWIASYMGGIFIVGKKKLVAAVTAANASKTASCTADAHISDHGKNALSGIHVGQMVVDSEGMVWASTFNRLDRINPGNLKVEHVEGTDVISYMMTDANGNVWVGRGNNVKCFFVNSAIGKAATHVADIKTKEWKIGNKVSTMCEVKDKIWVVCGDQCCVLDKRGKSFRFTVPSVLPLTMAYSKSSKEVVMGGNDALVKIRADMVGWNTNNALHAGGTPELLLTGVVVNGKQMQDSIDEAPRYMKEIHLKSDENNFTLQLSDLPFGCRPSRVYAYSLEGIDHGWHYLNGESLDITYNGLPYGDYHLTVHVLDGEGNVGEEVYSLDITVSAPWYLSVWAKLFYLLLAVGMACGAMKFYLVRERLAEEQRQKAEILEQVDARVNFFNRLAEDLKTAISHRSFDEITDLVNRSLGIKVEKVEAEKHATELSEADLRLLNEITEAIESHMIDSDFNVTTLQEVLGMGGKQLYRKLKAMTGKTPVEYIREMRMREAALMLKEGKFSVSEVMYSVGFSNSSYFSKCFSKEYGMTPTEYMKR